ncbi:sulfatase family protein [Persicirhabdus sediminis]|uniref:Sulfatase-like hydrolase/transferase n=1 Tax=Persicirhabdus sediminis TaxID=454144 RepID=A0A8J7MDT7_9BACT|nr:sulfatase-like hydrolase/transferase [Persicirhabdus sediminis]MBK1790009.1 sulfatase-like hydrolase/transferase [Persicirhabdus sediminis]
MNKTTLISLSALVCAASLSAAKQPNIIVILTDDLSYSSYSYTGNENIKTPHVDKLINDGVFFNQAYATHAVCAPSRAGLLTGRYQSRFHYETLSGNDKEAVELRHGVSTDEVFLSRQLKKSGYTTAAFGKWHLGVNEEFRPAARGFDYHFGFYGGGNGYFNWEGVYENGVEAKGEGYLTDALGDKAVSFIDRNKDKPFFIYFAPYNVHAPLDVDPKYLPPGTPYNKAKWDKKLGTNDVKANTIYDGMVVGFDAQVGKIVSKLDELGLSDDTLIFLTNDNGGTGQRMNPPFSGNKASYYEGGVRMPFAIKWPSQIKAGTTFDGMMSNLDIFPTSIAAAKGEMLTDRDYDGKDLLPYLKGEIKGAPHDQLFWRAGSGHFTRKGKYKLHWPVNRKTSAVELEKRLGRKVRKQDLPLYDQDYYLKPMLFDLSKDMEEKNDIADQFPEIVEALCKDIKDFDKLNETDKIQGTAKK